MTQCAIGRSVRARRERGTAESETREQALVKQQSCQSARLLNHSLQASCVCPQLIVRWINANHRLRSLMDLMGAKCEAKCTRGAN
jgi:hypothetical protein